MKTKHNFIMKWTIVSCVNQVFAKLVERERNKNFSSNVHLKDFVGIEDVEENKEIVWEYSLFPLISFKKVTSATEHWNEYALLKSL